MTQLESTQSRDAGRPAIATADFLSAGQYVVCAKTDDPIFRPARARLIWAANTAAATASLGVSTLLIGDVRGMPYKVETIAGTMAAKRRLRELYNVEPAFDIALVRAVDKAKNEDDKFPIPADYLASIFPRAGLVHTRDPATALACAKRKINYIFEHHDEDYQTRFKRWDNLRMEQSCCRAFVAITAKIKTVLLENGVPEDKIIVLDSGVSLAGADRKDDAAGQWRHQLLGQNYSKLVVYSGGMQAERGIADVIDVAQRMPRVMFAFCGGNPADLAQWTSLINGHRLNNVRVFGYIPHEVVCEVQQAADVLLLSRAPTERAEITSPLKFFDYLLSGTPIVSARIQATERFEASNGAIDWYEAGDLQSLEDALQRSFQRFEGVAKPHQANIEMGLQHSWEQRQRALLTFVGRVTVKTTF